MRREAVLQIGGFPENFDVMEDRAFMNRFLARWRVAILDKRLAYHHRRIQRAEDRTRNVLLNTLDNPSYDWRYFADLARPSIDFEADSAIAGVFRSIASDLLSEVNYETSAIWQKIDGEMRTLRAQLAEDRETILSQLDTVVSTLVPSDADSQKPVKKLAASKSAFYDLWTVFSEVEHAQYVAHNMPFAQRLALSIDAPQYGLLLHVSPKKRKLVLQISDTGEWAALELRLDGLVPTGQGLQCQLLIDSSESYLFETALQHSFKTNQDEIRHEASAFAVHDCDASSGGIISRTVPPEWLHSVSQPKLSIIFPRHCQNFRFICTDLVIEPLVQV